MNQKRTSEQAAALQSHQAPAGQSLASKLVIPEKAYAVVAVRTTPGPSPMAATTDQTEKTVEPAPFNCITDGETVTLITAVQRITIGLRLAEIEDNRFPIIMKAVCSLVMRM
jgi:hypothetical protein